MGETYSNKMWKLEQAANHDKILFENIKIKRKALLLQKREQLLESSLEAVRAFTSLVNTLIRLKRRRPRPWIDQKPKIDRCCSNVQLSWRNLDIAFCSALEAYDRLAQELKTLHNDVFLKRREEAGQLGDQISRDLEIVRGQIAGARSHASDLEQRMGTLVREWEELCAKHGRKVDTAGGAIKSSWICLGAGVGCFLLEPVFPPAGIMGWALMTGSYGSSATSFVFSSKAKRIESEMDTVSQNIAEAHGMLESMSTSERELVDFRVSLSKSQALSKRLLEASELVFPSTRSVESELLEDHQRSLFFVTRSCKLFAVEDIIKDSLSIAEAAGHVARIGGEFVEAARKVHQRSSLGSAGKQSGAKALLKLENSLNVLRCCMGSAEAVGKEAKGDITKRTDDVTERRQAGKETKREESVKRHIFFSIHFWLIDWILRLMDLVAMLWFLLWV